MQGYLEVQNSDLSSDPIHNDIAGKKFNSFRILTHAHQSRRITIDDKRMDEQMHLAARVRYMTTAPQLHHLQYKCFLHVMDTLTGSATQLKLLIHFFCEYI